MNTENPSAEPWQQRFPFDIDIDGSKRFDELVAKFEEWQKTEPITEPLGLTNGWYTVTPEMAESFLRRNPPGANRKASLATAIYYADQMKHGEWPKTGQAIIFDDSGRLLDGQHRLYAALLAGTAFETFIVTDVPAHPHIFAYIDNNRARSPAACLQTAGYNGVSPTIVAILKIAVDVETNAYSASSTSRRPRIPPIGYLRLVERHANAKHAARLAASDYEEAVTLSSHKDVIGYMAMRIIDLHDQETADRFFAELTDFDNDYGTDSAIMGLRKLILDDQKKEKPMKRHQVLGNMIKAFNAWQAGEPLKRRWFMGAHEEFPSFAEPAVPVADAA